MLSLEQLCDALDAIAVPALPAETVSLADAAGRILANDVSVPFDQPPEPMSAMDGYAIEWAAWQALCNTPDGLPVSQRVPAGSAPGPLVAGTAARIFTGAILPAGADTVVPQEQVQLSADGRVHITQAPRPGQWVRQAGAELKRGDKALSAGALITPAAVALLASMGLADVAVLRPLKVGLFFTGDELRQPGESLSRGQIYNSNRWMWRALLERKYITCVDHGSVPDNLPATRAALRALSHCDLILSSGGVSVGEEDHVRAAVEAEGSLQAWKVAMKPGKPIAVGRINRDDGTQAVFAGLPGNPVSSFAGFLLLLRPLLWRMARGGMGAGAVADAADACTGGAAFLRSVERRVPAAFDWLHPDPVRTEFLRVRLNEKGEAMRHPNQQSAALASVAWADGLVRLQPGLVVRAGEPVPYLSLSSLMLP